MAKSRKWYDKWIGYCFNDEDGRAVVLIDTFYFEDENGKPTGTGYEVQYLDTNERVLMDWPTFKNSIANYTRLPK